MKTRAYLAVAPFAAAVLAALAATAARPSGETPGTIVFTRADGIFVIRADGSGERPLIRRGATAGANRLAWAPDGRRLAFTNSKDEIWAMNADGSRLVRVVAGADISTTIFGSLTWSPDGRRIAFTGFQRKTDGTPRNWEIWVVDADGTHPHRLRRTPHLWELDVDWSPAGNRIAFTDLRGGGMWGPLRVMTTNGRILHSTDPGPAHNTAMPDWAPDGRRLAYVKWPNHSNNGAVFDESEIWVTTPDGKALQLTRNTVSDTSPAWSPDGSRIAFLRGRGSTLFVAPPKRSPAELYVMNADGTDVTRLTHNQIGEGSPAWQPDPSS